MNLLLNLLPAAPDQGLIYVYCQYRLYTAITRCLNHHGSAKAFLPSHSAHELGTMDDVLKATVQNLCSHCHGMPYHSTSCIQPVSRMISIGCHKAAALVVLCASFCMESWGQHSTRPKGSLCTPLGMLKEEAPIFLSTSYVRTISHTIFEASCAKGAAPLCVKGHWAA